MEKTRQYMMETLIEEVIQENKEASLAVEYWNSQQMSSESEVVVEEKSTNPITSTQEKSGNQLCKLSERWAIAGAIIFFALVYLGCYIHEIMTTSSEVMPQSHEQFFHYETERLPYFQEFPYEFKNLPYELNKYFFDQLASIY